MNDLAEVSWRMYQENITHARHHESQRASAITLSFALAAAITGLITLDKAIDLSDLPSALLLFCLGVFGSLFAAKQYERIKAHTMRARLYRDQLESAIPGSNLKALKTRADRLHEEGLPRLRRLRLNAFWIGFPLVLCVLGVILAALSLRELF